MNLKTRPPSTSVVDRLIKLLKQKRGTTMQEMVQASGWQAASVRGTLSGVIRKSKGLDVVCETASNGSISYRIRKELTK